MSNNFFKVDRGLLGSPRWLSEKFTRGQAWVDLFGLAQHADNFIRVRGVKVDVKRGQLARSLETLSDRWKWSKDKIIRYLKELENDGDISMQKSNVITLITILKYEQWQGKHNAEPTTENMQTDCRPVTYKKNKNKKKNNNIEHSYPPSEDTHVPPSPRTGEEEPVEKLTGNRRDNGTNPRALGTNLRATGMNPRALGTNPRNEEISIPDFIDGQWVAPGGDTCPQPGGGEKSLAVEKPERALTPIQKVLEPFYAVFGPDMDYGRNAKVVQRLLEKHSLDGLIEAASYAVSIQNQQYAPVITDVVSLERKMSDLKVFMAREMSPQKNTRKIIKV